MPRDLADVLHYFLSDSDGADVSGETTELGDKGSARPASRDAIAAVELPILGLLIGDRDVVRAALAWNLAVETARLGASAILVAPACDEALPLWPAPGIGPLGTELVFCKATDLAGLYRAAEEIARDERHRTKQGGIVFVRIPPSWLPTDAAEANPIRWTLLLSSSNRRDLHEAYDLAKTLARSNPTIEIGLTIHGVKSIGEARAAFEHLSRISERELGLRLASYGLLVDDLHVYRAIAAQRPIGLAHPQAPATRELMDVARLLNEDAGSRTLD